MSKPVTAEIIPFPARGVADPAPVLAALPAADPADVTGKAPDAPVPTASSAEAQERLTRALLALDAAVADQRMAVAAWRGALSDLSATMQGLSGSVQRYRGSLASLDGKVANLRSEASRLERWADDVTTINGQGT